MRKIAYVIKRRRYCRTAPNTSMSRSSSRRRQPSSRIAIKHSSHRSASTATVTVRITVATHPRTAITPTWARVRASRVRGSHNRTRTIIIAVDAGSTASLLWGAAAACLAPTPISRPRAAGRALRGMCAAVGAIAPSRMCPAVRLTPARMRHAPTARCRR